MSAGIDFDGPFFLELICNNVTSSPISSQFAQAAQMRKTLLFLSEEWQLVDGYVFVADRAA
jgi:hypothetical protein